MELSEPLPLERPCPACKTKDALAPVLSRTSNMWDWPCSHSYCIALAEHLGIPIRFQWREGRILGGILRTNSPPGARLVELADYGTAGADAFASPRVDATALGTRQLVPQVASDLRVRWCSSYVKMEVSDAGITADPRFDRADVLLVTGERREEGGNRSKYAASSDRTQPPASGAPAGRGGRPPPSRPGPGARVLWRPHPGLGPRFARLRAPSAPRRPG